MSSIAPRALALAVGVTGARADLVINEIHYDAEPKTEFVEFIELLNTNSTPLDASGYRFSEGVDTVLPPGTLVPAMGYLVVAENPAALAAKFTLPAETQILAYDGALDNDGETITLRDASGGVSDEVDFRAEFPWPISPNGEGASMQLINATLDNDLGGAWRGAPPTPGVRNAVYSGPAPPIVRQVEHSPKEPTAADPIVISAKITDAEGVASAHLLYQIVSPGEYIPAFLPHPYGTLTGNPGAPLPPNPAFEDPANWTAVAMVEDGSGNDTYTATVPAQNHRTLVRYRIVSEDSLATSVRVPYPDDASLNFAAFVYDGVPDYVAGDATHPSPTLTTLPVYHMITRDEDRAYAFAYSTTGDGGFQIPKSNVAARKVYNWECALVYDGVVYDHVGWRLRQRNDRYAGNGKRSMRFRMNRGHYFQARGEDGRKLPVKWRRFNTSKMSRFGGTNSYGLHETINSKLWRMVGVEAPYFLPAHWRMIDDAAEAPDQWGGDFFGLATVMQDIDGRLLDERGLPNGNMYKLKDGVSDPLELQRNQTRYAVDDGSDFQNIMSNLDSGQGDAWLEQHVDWDQWARYHAVVEAVRHYDFGTPSTHLKNRAWYFEETPGTPFGLLRIVPHDHDASWSRGYHDNLNNVGNSIGTGFPWAAIFDDIRRPPAGTEKTAFTIPYRNFIREFRQLLWQEETVHPLIDDQAAKIREFSLADRARWTGAPAAAGAESMTAVDNIVASMKEFAFVSDTVYGSNLPGGRGAFLDQIAADSAVPDQPTIGYSGEPGFPPGGIEFTASTFSAPQGIGSFAAMEWRIAEVAGLGEAGEVELLPPGAVWSYLDDGSDQGTAWRAPGFDDTAWATGALPAGYGTINNGTVIATTVDFGGVLTDRHITTYFRRGFGVADPTAYSSLILRMNVDDGVAVYINGTEVLRDRLAEGAAFDTPASGNGNEGIYDEFIVPPDSLVPGINVIAVELHNRSSGNSDVVLDMGIAATPALPDRTFEWDPTWESGELGSFNATISPPASATRAGHNYRARVRHKDNTGRWSEWSEPLEFTAGAPDISLYTNSVVISEIMYHPAEPTPAEIAAGFDDDDAFEYIEVRNVGGQAVELGDVRLTKGVDFDFDGMLDAGETALVVNDLAGFEFRYGSGLPVVGVWSGKLDNGGERLKLSFGAGEAIRDFVYDDTRPWPVAADGAGSALVLVDPFGLPDHGNPFSWRTAPPSPGTTDATSFPGGDLAAYGTSGAVSPTLLPDGSAALTVELNQRAEDLSFRWECSGDLSTWSAIDAPISAATPTAGGFAATTFTLPPQPGEARRFYRLVVELR